MGKAPEIKYFTIAPPVELSSYVRFFWVLEGENISGEPYVYRSMADGCVEMLFHYRGIWDQLHGQKKTKSFAAGIQGPVQHHRRFVIQRDFGLFGVYLYPYALPCLFSIPAEALSNQMPEFREFLPDKGRQLEERIMLATSNEERVALLVQFLMGQLRQQKNKEPAICSAIRHMIQKEGRVNVLQLAAGHFLSVRQFQRKFKLYAGFPPKFYARIVRFDFAMQHYGRSGKSLTQIAYDCGYYDQSHFIRDFKMFSGYSPKDYFRGEAEGIEWRNS